MQQIDRSRPSPSNAPSVRCGTRCTLPTYHGGARVRILLRMLSHGLLSIIPFSVRLPDDTPSQYSGRGRRGTRRGGWRRATSFWRRDTSQHCDCAASANQRALQMRYTASQMGQSGAHTRRRPAPPGHARSPLEVRPHHESRKAYSGEKIRLYTAGTGETAVGDLVTGASWYNAGISSSHHSASSLRASRPSGRCIPASISFVDTSPAEGSGSNSMEGEAKR